MTLSRCKKIRFKLLDQNLKKQKLTVMFIFKNDLNMKINIAEDA